MKTSLLEDLLIDIASGIINVQSISTFVENIDCLDEDTKYESVCIPLVDALWINTRLS